MKNTMLAMAVASLMASAVAPSAFAFGPSASGTTVTGGTLNFEGQVVDAACSVSSKSANDTVTLGQVRSAKLDRAGATSGQKTAFSIDLEDCDSTVSQNAAVTFSGQEDSAQVGSLANTAGSGAATNVALQLYGPDGNVLNFGEESSKVALVDGTNSLPFSVDYIATARGVTAGNVAATATFSLHYS